MQGSISATTRASSWSVSGNETDKLDIRGPFRRFIIEKEGVQHVEEEDREEDNDGSIVVINV